MLKPLSLVGVGVGAWYFLGLSVWKSLLASTTAYLATGGWRFAKVVAMTLPRDIG